MFSQQLMDGSEPDTESSQGLIRMISMQLTYGFEATHMDGFKSRRQTLSGAAHAWFQNHSAPAHSPTGK